MHSKQIKRFYGFVLRGEITLPTAFFICRFFPFLYLRRTGSPSTIKWNCLLHYCDDMDCERLMVQTVPAFDPITLQLHTAYTVYRLTAAGSVIQSASGWTLQDAIGYFCRYYRIHRDNIKLIRPFLPQRTDWYDNQ
jgi:hypothetical protein